MEFGEKEFFHLKSFKAHQHDSRMRTNNKTPSSPFLDSREGVRKPKVRAVNRAVRLEGGEKKT